MLTYTNMAQTGHRATWHWAATQSQPWVGAVHRSADWDRWHLTEPLEEKQGWIKGRPIPVQQQPAPIPVDQHQWRVAVFQEEEQVALCCLQGDNKVNFHPPEVVPPAVGLSTPLALDPPSRWCLLPYSVALLHERLWASGTRWWDEWITQKGFELGRL